MPSTVDMFCCCAHEDQQLLDELKKHLKPLQELGLGRIQSDLDIGGGLKLEEEVNKLLDTAHIILLLISPDFIGSDDCNKEMQRAVRLHEQDKACVIPVLLRIIATFVFSMAIQRAGGGGGGIDLLKVMSVIGLFLIGIVLSGLPFGFVAVGVAWLIGIICWATLCIRVQIINAKCILRGGAWNTSGNKSTCFSRRSRIDKSSTGFRIVREIK